MSKKKRSKQDILGLSLRDLLDDNDFDNDFDNDQDRDQSAIRTPVPANEESPASTSSTLQIDDLDVLQSFLQETGEHLETIEEKIVELEKSESTDILDEIFRAMHTIKGTSAFFGTNAVTTLSHAVESLLDNLRQGKIEVTAELIDLLLAGADELLRMNAQLVSAAADKGSEKPPFTLRIIHADLDTLLSRIFRIETAAQPSAPLPPAGLSREAPRDEGTNDIYRQFVTESSDLLAEMESDILAMEKDPENLKNIDRPFRNIHTIKGNAGFLGLEQVEELCIGIEEVLERLRRGEQSVTPALTTTLLRTIDSLAAIVRNPVDEEDEDQKVDYRPLGEILVEMGAADEETVDRALDSQDRKLGEILVSDGRVGEEAVTEALARQRKAFPSTGSADMTGADRSVIRVDVTKLDKLFELVGELIMAEAMVVSNPDLAGLELERFERSASYLGKITRQIQEITMSVRMIPLEGLFNKMRRLVRDLSRRTDKAVEIHVSGQDTEMDRNVIEVLADPLVHMLRNCVDHGIESKADRMKAGKSQAGNIILSAHYEGSEIWITIRDDGRGLKRQKIVDKIVSRGLASEEELEKRSDKAIWEFLFQAGFSTAEVVSDVSGRGVGMDVVRQNIERIRGKIDIDTEPGVWTEIILKIPLTMAIIDGVTARVGQTLYAIPLGDIREFQRALEENIQGTNTSGEVFSLRDEIIPVIRLQEFFRGSTKAVTTDQATFIVVQSGGDRAALLVDEIVSYSQIVVKPLPDFLGKMDGISGCSVLGNGDVSLIVDTSSLLKREKVNIR